LISSDLGGGLFYLLFVCLFLIEGNQEYSKNKLLTHFGIPETEFLSWKKKALSNKFNWELL